MSLVTGAQLRAARAMLRLDQEKLAALAGISANTIRNLEGNEGPLNARMGTVRALQQALETAGVEFLPDEGIRRRREAATAS